MNEPKSYAFWRYDKFPYVLGGIVTKLLPTGNVEVEGFGTNTTGFKPIMVIPQERGRIIAKNLERLKASRDQQIADIEQNCLIDLYHISSEIYLRLKSDGVTRA